VYYLHIMQNSSPTTNSNRRVDPINNVDKFLNGKRTLIMNGSLDTLVPAKLRSVAVLSIACDAVDYNSFTLTLLTIMQSIVHSESDRESWPHRRDDIRSCSSGDASNENNRSRLDGSISRNQSSLLKRVIFSLRLENVVDS